MNAVETDNRHDWVELNQVLHEYPQLGRGGGRNTNIMESQRNHGRGGGAELRDEPSTSDDSSNKAPVATRCESSLLKADVIPGSHGTANLSVMKAKLFVTLEELVHRTCSSLPISGWLVTFILTAKSFNILYGHAENL